MMEFLVKHENFSIKAAMFASSFVKSPTHLPRHCDFFVFFVSFVVSSQPE